ncbi:flagellar basal body rod protein FlgC [Acetobacterium carbinolicum]|jgi:flagellar basal-body rod protein FlgC|uniref:flagellar basal body rod protein FlgC n=1 Tax=Acetobacterium TaxID=33951 RepID=UPI000DBEC3E5|nr:MULTISPECIES: flagellar basal body rod protein FlgC [unclassified Acetobacterium]AWW26369.1 flagellar basal body rod protein FlgC [Acetobacterium sp. KB-1]MDK2942893.1 flagellar basal-body rod protein FlgC [Acetobacterium sp.]MDZ5726221.1 flagellar basal body rod protein FlgC [Acetobacterium sp. K1/6]
MSFLSSFNISGSGMTAQKYRLDVVAQNIANAKVTRTEEGEPYRRKMTVLSSVNTGTFLDALKTATGAVQKAGVQVEAVIEDESALVPVYDPTHPDANAEGYVMYPNVNTAQEMTDAMGASRAYEANVTAFNATKSIVLKALEIGR